MLKFVFVLVFALTGCSPKFDWRDVRSKASPFTVLMPDKPSELSNEVQLGDQRVTMHMTATRVDDITFAVGVMKMSDPTAAHAAVALVRNALITNMGGSITQETVAVADIAGKQIFTDKFDAIGKSDIRMIGRVMAHDVWAYEVLVVGPKNSIDTEAADTFLNSFRV